VVRRQLTTLVVSDSTDIGVTAPVDHPSAQFRLGVGAAALCIDILPEKLLNRILGRGAGRRGILIGKGCQSGQAGFRSGLDVDAVDGETEASCNPPAERPRGHGNIVVRKCDCFINNCDCSMHSGYRRSAKDTPANT